MILWGIGMSAQGSLFQAILTGVIPQQKRSTAFGLFDTGYGIAWFLGKRGDGIALRQIDSGCRTVFSHSSTCSDFPSFLSRIRSAKLSRGSVRKTKRAKSRRAATEDHAFAKLRGKTNPARTPGGEASSRSRATRNQEGGTSALKGAIAQGIGAETSEPGVLCSSPFNE